MQRRSFLKGAGVCIALPAMESLADAKELKKRAKAKTFVAIGTYLGWYHKSFYPTSVGSAYEMPELLKPISKHREDFSIFSGLDHRSSNGHKYWSNFLCGQKPTKYSLDQIIADKISQQSRFQSIRVVTGAGDANVDMSYSRQGMVLPTILRPSVLYKQMFLSKADRKQNEQILRSGKSSLDFVLEDAKRLQKSVSSIDANKLDEYFTSLRSVEKRMDNQLEHINDPVPETDYKLPSSDPITPNLQMEAASLMYDLMALAIQNESSRVLTMLIHGLGQVFSFDGETLGSGYHGLSHHGNDPVMVADLIKIEKSHIKCFNGFLNQLKEKKDAQGQSLLDTTIVLLGTGMGDASTHSSRNLPTIVAGGGFKHGSHVSVKEVKNRPLLLGDLYITLQQQLGIDCDRFSNASRNLNHLLESS